MSKFFDKMGNAHDDQVSAGYANEAMGYNADGSNKSNDNFINSAVGKGGGLVLVGGIIILLLGAFVQRYFLYFLFVGITLLVNFIFKKIRLPGIIRVPIFLIMLLFSVLAPVVLYELAVDPVSVSHEKIIRTTESYGSQLFKAGDLQGEVLETLAVGDEVEIIGVKRDRFAYKVTSAAGNTGYLHVSALPSDVLPIAYKTSNAAFSGFDNTRRPGAAERQAEGRQSASGKDAKVIPESVEVYSSIDSTGKYLLTTLNKGSIVFIKKEPDWRGYYQVEFDGKTGLIAQDCLEVIW